MFDPDQRDPTYPLAVLHGANAQRADAERAYEECLRRSKRWSAIRQRYLNRATGADVLGLVVNHASAIRVHNLGRTQMTVTFDACYFDASDQSVVSKSDALRVSIAPTGHYDEKETEQAINAFIVAATIAKVPLTPASGDAAQALKERLAQFRAHGLPVGERGGRPLLVTPGERTQDWAAVAHSLANLAVSGAAFLPMLPPTLKPEQREQALELRQRLDEQTLVASLRAARSLARAIRDQQLERFVGLESGGYFESTMPQWGVSTVPEYRKIAVQPIDATGVRIMITDADMGFLNEAYLRSPVSELEEMAAAKHPQFFGADALWITAFNNAMESLNASIVTHGGGKPRAKGYQFERRDVKAVIERVRDALNDELDRILTLPVAASEQSSEERPAARPRAERSLTADERADRARLAIITALPKEAAAMKLMLDHVEPVVRKHAGISKTFDVGETEGIDGTHYVIVAQLGDMGNNQAAAWASIVLAAFPQIQQVLMVGIAGAVPNPEKPDDHVRLGDIVVSDRNGVVQYDLEKLEIDVSDNRSPPRPPSSVLLEAVNRLRQAAATGQRPWLNHLKRAETLENSARPPPSLDTLVEGLDVEVAIEHPDDPQRRPGEPRVFYGPIASANKLLKNFMFRDNLRNKFRIKAVEMEGSGIADAAWIAERAYLVVRGTCDYCNTKKGDDWQEYAATIAAAYAKALLAQVPTEVSSSKIDPTPFRRSEPALVAKRLPITPANESARRRMAVASHDLDVRFAATMHHGEFDILTLRIENTSDRRVSPRAILLVEDRGPSEEFHLPWVVNKLFSSDDVMLTPGESARVALLAAETPIAKATSIQIPVLDSEEGFIIRPELTHIRASLRIFGEGIKSPARVPVSIHIKRVEAQVLVELGSPAAFTATLPPAPDARKRN